MYSIFFVNFWYGPEDRLATLEEAIAFAKSKGFDAAIRLNDEAIGYWSIVRGFTKF